jgi:hypothetical protein
MAFVAAPLHRLWRTDLSQWLVQNRRFLGLSMAVSHGFHGVTIGPGHQRKIPGFAAGKLT